MEEKKGNSIRLIAGKYAKKGVQAWYDTTKSVKNGRVCIIVKLRGEKENRTYVHKDNISLCSYN